MYCKYCGEQIDDDCIICPKCGKQVGELKPASGSNAFAVGPSGKSRMAAGLFAILLGGIGVHNFYMGKVGRGIVDILFCWTCIPSIVALVVGIMILCESDEDFEKRLQAE